MWSSQATAEAKKYCEVNEIYPDSNGKYTTLPDSANWKIDKEAAYVHYCYNETVHGVEFPVDFPFELFGDQIVVCDMSSNICTKPVAWEKYGVVYAGAQKNIGPSGTTIVVVREDLIGKY